MTVHFYLPAWYQTDQHVRILRQIDILIFSVEISIEDSLNVDSFLRFIKSMFVLLANPASLHKERIDA